MYLPHNILCTYTYNMNTTRNLMAIRKKKERTLCGDKLQKCKCFLCLQQLKDEKLFTYVMCYSCSMLHFNTNHSHYHKLFLSFLKYKITGNMREITSHNFDKWQTENEMYIHIHNKAYSDCTIHNWKFL
jgi:hypothetical protein